MHEACNLWHSWARSSLQPKLFFLFDVSTPQGVVGNRRQAELEQAWLDGQKKITTLWVIRLQGPNQANPSPCSG